MQPDSGPSLVPRARTLLRIASFLFVILMLVRHAATANPAAPVVANGGAALKPISASALQALVDATVHESLIPGAVVLLRTPQGEFTAAAGTTELGTMNTPAAGTYFRIASNTKTMTAALIVLLAQDGKLKLSDPVAKYVASVPDGDRITLAELLDMRSGLYNYTDAPELAASFDRDMTKSWAPDELLKIAFSHKPNFAPDAEYEYCNTNYLLLTLIVEKLTGKSLGDAMHDRLFVPLGMHHTLYPASDVTTLPEPYAHGYLYGSAANNFIENPSYSAAYQAEARAGTVHPTDFTRLNHSFSAGAGAVISNADDLAIWIQALVSGRVFDAAYQQRWIDSLRPVDPSKPNGQQYGYGISQLRWAKNFMYFHGGETPGYNSFIGYDPVNKVTLIVWASLTLTIDGKPAANTIMLKVLDQIYTASPLTPPAPGEAS